MVVYGGTASADLRLCIARNHDGQRTDQVGTEPILDGCALKRPNAYALGHVCMGCCVCADPRFARLCTCSLLSSQRKVTEQCSTGLSLGDWVVPTVMQSTLAGRIAAISLLPGRWPGAGLKEQVSALVMTLLSSRR